MEIKRDYQSFEPLELANSWSVKLKQWKDRKMFDAELHNVLRQHFFFVHRNGAVRGYL
jgi:hypothetical protein